MTPVCRVRDARRTQPNSGLNYDTAAPRALLLIIRGLSHISVASRTGGGEKNFAAKEDAWGQRNAGCIRQPFPDVCMALTMIWYLTDGNERTGGTWIVPGSHRDHRNPRGLHDNMNVA